MSLPNPKALSRKILSEPVNKCIFNTAGTGVFLVGGYLRDLLLGRQSMDIDYVVDGNPFEIAGEVSRQFRGTLIIFKKRVFRIVLPDGRIIDFTPIRGNIQEDLMLRDFTINAMAWSTEGGIIDPSGGIRDLEKGIIRVLSPESLKDDPLRVLRAYRHAVELSFSIDKETSRLLKEHAPGLKSVSPERITHEFFRILNHKHCAHYLSRSLDHNVLGEIIKLKGEKLKDNLRSLKRFEGFIDRNDKKIDSFFRRRSLKGFMEDEISKGLVREGLIKLFITLNGIKMIQRQCRLSLSGQIIKAIKDFNRALKQLDKMDKRLTDERLYRIFLSSGEHVYETSLILSIFKEKRLEEFLKRADDFVRFKRRPLLDGNEIKHLLGCERGIIIGKARAFLLRAEFLGQARTKRKAKNLLLSNFT